MTTVRQTFERDGHFCEFGSNLPQTSACDPTHEHDDVREFYLHLNMWDGAERTDEVLVHLTKSVSLNIAPGTDEIEAELAHHREQMIAEALAQVGCIRDARELEREATKRVQEFLKQPV